MSTPLRLAAATERARGRTLDQQGAVLDQSAPGSARRYFMAQR